jgi:hypothetical protein
MAQAMRLEGSKQLERKLNAIATQGGKAVSRAAMAGAVVPAKKAIRRGVNSANISGPVKRAARTTIGSSVKKQPGCEYGAKVGLSVGKPTKAKKAKASARAAAGKTGEKAGVGLSSANIHWFILGTKIRHTKSGKSTGRIEAELAGIVPQAINTARGEMISEAGRRAAVALKREAMKRR